MSDNGMNRLANPFPALVISDNDAKELEALSKVFVQRTISQYEQFLDEERGQVDMKRWKSVKERGDVCAYVERSDHIGIDSPQNPAIPVCLIAGTMEGDLDDAIYGFVSATMDAMRIKTAYAEDQFVRAAILTTLIKPTTAEPFRTLLIKWAEKGRPLPVRAVFKNRDFVYMEATGVEHLRNGERVGFQLLHSVQFPETSELESMVRGNMSICGLVRQKTKNEIDVYIRGYLNPAGGLERAVAVKSISNGLLSVTNVVYCAQMRKLTWRMRQRSSILNQSNPIEETLETLCGSCSKPRSTRYVNIGKRGKSTCKICFQYTCSSCKIKKSLIFIEGERLSYRTVSFCRHCVSDALEMKAADVAREELLATDCVSWNEKYDSSGTDQHSFEEL